MFQVQVQYIYNVCGQNWWSAIYWLIDSSVYRFSDSPTYRLCDWQILHSTNWQIPQLMDWQIPQSTGFQIWQSTDWILHFVGLQILPSIDCVIGRFPLYRFTDSAICGLCAWRIPHSRDWQIPQFMDMQMCYIPYFQPIIMNISYYIMITDYN